MVLCVFFPLILYRTINTSGRRDTGFVYTGFTVYSTTAPFFKCRPISFSIFLITLRLIFLACGRRLSRCPGPPYLVGCQLLFNPFRSKLPYCKKLNALYEFTGLIFELQRYSSSSSTSGISP